MMVTAEVKTSNSANSLSSLHMSTRKEAVKMQLEPNDVLNESGTLLDHWMDQDTPGAAQNNGEANGELGNSDGVPDDEHRRSNVPATHPATIAEDSADLFEIFRWSKALPDDEFEYRRHVFGYHHQTHMCRNQSPLKMKNWFQDFDFDGKQRNPFALLRNAIRAGRATSSGKRQSAIAKSSLTPRLSTPPPNLGAIRASRSHGVTPTRRSFFGVSLAEKAVTI